MKKIVVATVKPFAPAAVEGIKKMAQEHNFEVEVVEKYDGQAALIEAVKTADALIVRSDKVTPQVLEAATKLKIVVRAGAGYDNVNLKTATNHNIVVMNTPGQNSNAVAELAFGMMVFFARNQFNGKPGTELMAKKLGIHAYGHVGKQVARIAKGFGMEVFAYDPFVSKQSIEDDGVNYVESAQKLYATCQYVSLHIPANEKTRASIGYDLLSSMPPNAVLVNTARKEVINEDQMLRVLAERKDFAYISDIAPDCRPEIEQQFEGQYFFTPKKMGAQTAEANFNAGIAAATQIINFFEKGDETFKVN